MLDSTAVHPTQQPFISSDAVYFLYPLLPSVTFGILASMSDKETGSAVITATFYGKAVRDGSLLKGDTLVSDVVFLFCNNDHFQVLALQGNLEIYHCSPEFSLAEGCGTEVVALDCTILVSEPWLAGV